jgi:hypothetical protein
MDAALSFLCKLRFERLSNQHFGRGCAKRNNDGGKHEGQQTMLHTICDIPVAPDFGEYDAISCMRRASPSWRTEEKYFSAVSATATAHHILLLLEFGEQETAGEANGELEPGFDDMIEIICAKKDLINWFVVREEVGHHKGQSIQQPLCHCRSPLAVCSVK